MTAGAAVHHGLSERTLAKLREVLSGHPEIEGAVLYGSRAKGTHRPGSDIDLALVGDAVNAGVCSRVWQDLDDSDIPYRVDVTALQRLAHEPLAEHIRRVGVLVYQRNAGA